MPDDRYGEELKSYIPVGKRYIRKSNVLAAVFAVLALAAALASVGIPLYRKYFGIMTVSSPWLQEYSGRGEVYDLDRKLLYEGDIVGGVFTGLGKLYRGGRELLYEGGFLNGEFSGEGVLYDKDGYIVYQGSFVNGKREGSGRLYKQNVLIYDGEFLDGEYGGWGKQYSDGEILYSGFWANGAYNGTGKLYKNGEPLYSGAFLDGLYNGQGKLYSEGELLYEGEFLAGVYSGQGKLYDKAVLIYDGGFRAGKYDGRGLLYKGLRLLYDGDFLDGLYSGQGKLYTSSQSLLYEGGFLNGEYSGQGLEYNELGRLVYNGAYTNGKRNGFGELYSDRGNLLYNGLFLQGEIDYVSLLGKRHSEILSIFPGRSYLSYGSQTTLVSMYGEDGALIFDEIDFFEEYFCEGYEEIKAAIIFGGKDGKPDCAEAIIVWELSGDYDFASYIGREIPFWINVFYDNELCPIWLESPVRRVTQVYQDGYQIYFWMEDSDMEADFYTIEYRSEYIEVK